MGNDEKETTPQQSIFNEVNRLYRAAARLQYTILQSDTIDYSNSEKVGELWEDLHDAGIEASNAIETLKEMER